VIEKNITPDIRAMTKHVNMSPNLGICMLNS